jgi:hypothetical protein
VVTALFGDVMADAADVEKVASDRLEERLVAESGVGSRVEEVRARGSKSGREFVDTEAKEGSAGVLTDVEGYGARRVASHGGSGVCLGHIVPRKLTIAEF